VAAYLNARHSLPSVVVWAGEQEKSWAEEVVAGAGGCARLAPATTLKELAALARRARLFIGSDTGPLHLAAAVGTPCIGLYGPMPAERNGPYGAQHIALQAMGFEGTRHQRRKASRELMDSIPISLVCEACDQILARTGAEA
jgi:ADP-heptose:LPS heptosyltransferase